MADNLVQARVEAIRRLVRRRAHRPLARALDKSSAGDIVEAVAHLTRAQTLFLLEHLEDKALAGEVLLGLPQEVLLAVVHGVEFDTLVAWLDEIEPDDEADIIARLPDELRERVLTRIDAADRQDVEELLAWPDDSAGGIMSPIVFQVGEETTCREAIEALQEAGDVEMVFYLYIVNDSGQLVGVTSLRNLLINPPSTSLKSIMSSDVIAVSPETDQEEVARIAARYDLLAVPVADETRKLLGIVTIDDVIDVIREEAVEDLLKMAGVGESFDPHGASATTSARARVRWLTVTLVAGLVLSEVIGGFEQTLARQAAIAGFIPVVMGMGGNVGIQAATITVRNLATGHVSPTGGVAALLLRESRVGILLGLVFGSALAIWGLVRFWPNWSVGASVGMSVLLALMAASVLGTMIPLTLERLKIDPALATGPFVTTLIDLLGVVVYFLVCTKIFGL
jgi:magnesium transporter